MEKYHIALNYYSHFLCPLSSSVTRSDTEKQKGEKVWKDYVVGKETKLTLILPLLSGLPHEHSSFIIQLKVLFI